MTPRLLLMLARMARRRPKPREMIMMGVVLVLVTLVVSIEHFVGWPDWATVNRMR